MPTTLSQPPTRDLEKEKPWVDEFININQRLPNTAADWAWVHKQTYGADLPSEFRDVQAELEKMTDTTAPTAPRTPEEMQAELNRLQGARETAQAGYTGALGEAQAAERGTPQTLQVFQEALKRKITTTPSVAEEAYEGAGIKGYGALQNSMEAKRSEIGSRYSSFRNLFNEMKGEMHKHNQELIDNADLALQEYKMLDDQYNTMFDSLQKIDSSEKDLADRLQLMERQAELDRENYKYEQEHKVFAPKTPSKTLTQSQLNKMATKGITTDIAYGINLNYSLGNSHADIVNGLVAEGLSQEQAEAIVKAYDEIIMASGELNELERMLNDARNQ